MYPQTHTLFYVDYALPQNNLQASGNLNRNHTDKGWSASLDQLTMAHTQNNIINVHEP
jgi:hypothetical protein